MGLKDCPRGAHMWGGGIGRGVIRLCREHHWQGSPALKGPLAELGVANAVRLLLDTEHFKTPRVLLLGVRT